MNPTLREQLIRAEQHFLLAVASNDEESLKVFSQEWSQLAREVEDTKAAGRLDDNTAHLLSEVSQAIENMTACILESGVILQESLACSIDDLIQDIPSSDPPITSLHSLAIAPCRLLFSDLSSSTILGQQKLLDSYAYCWLMQNIHDPYPNSVQTRIISDTSGSSVAQVELWFQEARDSIGWSKLSRDFFAGSVNATVAAAQRVYLERDKNISFDIIFAFTTVKAFAGTLFSECPPLQGKNVDTESVGSIAHHHIGFSPGEYIIDTDSILVPPHVDYPAPLDPLSDLSDSDESEMEDTTPPPSIAGCKRFLAEDEFTTADLGRQHKRPRTWSVNLTPSEPEYLPPLPSTLVSSEQFTRLSAAPVSPFPSLHQVISPTSPGSFSGPPPSINQRKRHIELDEDSPECAVSSTHTDVSVHGIRKRRRSQCVPPAPSKRQHRFSISGTNSTPSSDECRGRPTDLDEFPQSMLQVPIDSDVPVNLDVYDWNSIRDPLAGMASSISQVAEVYVSSSDLASQLLEPSDPGHDAKITSSLFSDLGLLEGYRSSLQFPMPAGRPPDPSTSFPVLPHSGDSSLLFQDLDWSTITESINLFPSGSTQSSSPSTSSSDPLTPPENSYESLPLSQSCDAGEQLFPELHSSVPPSVFLPFRSDAFTEDVNNMWS